MKKKKLFIGENKAIKKTAGKEKKPFYIVGMGASAGGLNAFESFFKNMPSQSDMAFIIVTHLDPTHFSIMPELIQKCTKMKVFQVQGNLKVEPNSVYLIPPNKYMVIFHGSLQLIDPIEPSGHRTPINYFLHSLAEDQKEKAIGIIFSGMGSDGSLGLKAVKEKQGMTIAQLPASAQYDSMPESAIKTGSVDYIVLPEKMPEQLIKYVTHTIPATVREIPSDALQKIFILLRENTGHDFSFYKPNTIYRRLEKRMNALQIDNISYYIRYMQEKPNEAKMLFKEFLIGVTNFFRDAPVFEFFKNQILPELLKDKPNDYSVRVWVPGCSTGEEAYSIAILFNEYMDESKQKFNIQIFGTDIDDDAINTARAGLYPHTISDDLTQERLTRFFTKEGNFYKIKKKIREMIIFAPQDIIKNPPFTKLDMICCRNLLIYLNSEVQKKLFPIFHYSLKPEGILILGSSETIGNFIDIFSVVDKKIKIFKRKVSASAINAVEFPIIPSTYKTVENRLSKIKEFNMEQQLNKIMLENYVPPCVIINENGSIIYIHGRTGKYLEFAPGEASLNILDMVNEEIKLELISAIHKVLSQKKEVLCEGLKVKYNGGRHVINLRVKPVNRPDIMQGLMMVVFEDVISTSSPPLLKEKKTELHDKKTNKKIEQLEKELKYTAENLQTTIEELETANEELKSTNEELQSTNEELQSANEEMETSKEELQSLNEELLTVNMELQNKINELSKINNDMKNLFDSTEIATVFLDNNLCIKRFTTYVTKIINLIQTDIGRPINHIATNLKYENLIKDANEVIKTMKIKEIEVLTNDGQWYLMRILPYKTIDDLPDGVTITFITYTEKRCMNEKK